MYPVLYSSNWFTLYSYPLFMGLAWGVGYYFSQYIFEKNNVEHTKLINLFLGIFISSWLGAKVFFLLFSSQQKLNEYLHADYFWLGGGFVFYGGLISGLLFYYFYSVVLKKFDYQKTYLLIPGLVLGHAIGRVGCFLTGCCYGSVCELPWKVLLNDKYRHPVQLYEVMGLLVIGYFSLTWIKQKQSNESVVFRYIISYSILRFFVEFFRGDDIRGIYWLSLSTSQLVAIVFIILAIVFAKIGQSKSLK